MPHEPGFSIFPRHLYGVLTMPEIAVFVALRSYYPNPYPSHQTLADKLFTSVSTIQRTLKSLKEKGVLEWESQVREDGGQTSNLYLVRDTPVGHSDRPPSVTLTDPLGHSDRRRRTNELEQVRTKTLLAARAKEDQMHLGKLPDDPPPEVEQDTAAKAGRKRVLLAWANAAGDVGVRRWNRGLLNKTLSDLRKQGYSDDEIEILLGSFFKRDPQNLRTKAREHDLAILFGQELNSGLEARCDEALRRHRSGGRPLIEAVGLQMRELERQIMEDHRRKHASA